MKSVFAMNAREKDALAQVAIDAYKKYHDGAFDFTKTNLCRDFLLKYTTIRWDTSRKEWELGKTILLPRNTGELIYEVSWIQSRAKSESIILKSWKGNWDECSLVSWNPKEGEIPLWQLFPDYIHRTYIGEVWMG